MTIKQRMNNYLIMHLKVFKKSNKLNKPLSQIFLTLAKYVSLLLLLILFIFILVRLFIGVLPLLSSIDKMSGAEDFITNPSLINAILEQSSLLTGFVLKAILLLIFIALMLSLLLAFFNSVLITRINNTKWNVKQFLKMLLVYSIITMIYFILLFLMLYYMSDMVLLAILSIILTLIYSYIIVMFQIALENISLLNYLKKGILNCLKLHKTLPVIIVGLIALVVVILISAFASILLKKYIILLLLPLLLLLDIWVLNYQYQILKYTK